jgi:hypothetical protein
MTDPIEPKKDPSPEVETATVISSEPPPAAAAAAADGPRIDKGKMGMRLVYILLVGVMFSVAAAALNVLTIVQFIVMLADNGKTNAQISAVGLKLGAWMSKAAKFQLNDDADKPWPWSPLE